MLLYAVSVSRRTSTRFLLFPIYFERVHVAHFPSRTKMPTTLEAWLIDRFSCTQDMPNLDQDNEMKPYLNCRYSSTDPLVLTWFTPPGARRSSSAASPPPLRLPPPRRYWRQHQHIRHCVMWVWEQEIPRTRGFRMRSGCLRSRW